MKLTMKDVVSNPERNGLAKGFMQSVYCVGTATFGERMIACQADEDEYDDFCIVAQHELVTWMVFMVAIVNNNKYFNNDALHTSNLNRGAEAGMQDYRPKHRATGSEYEKVRDKFNISFVYNRMGKLTNKALIPYRDAIMKCKALSKEWERPELKIRQCKTDATTHFHIDTNGIQRGSIPNQIRSGTKVRFKLRGDMNSPENIAKGVVKSKRMSQVVRQRLVIPMEVIAHRIDINDRAIRLVNKVRAKHKSRWAKQRRRHKVLYELHEVCANKEA